MIFWLSVAASRLMKFFPTVFLGLTPQAMSLSPLRGWADLSPKGECGVAFK